MREASQESLKKTWTAPTRAVVDYHGIAKIQGVLARYFCLGGALLLALAAGTPVTAKPVIVADRSLPVLTNIDQVRSLTSEEALRRYPVRIEAVFTCVYGIWGAAVQNGDEGIWVQFNDNKPEISIGEQAVIEGVSSPGDFLPIIRYQHITPLGKAPLPVPERLPNASASFRQLDCRWVETAGIVHSVSNSKALSGIPLLALDSDGTRINIQLHWPKNTPLPTDLIDARIQIRGVALSEWNARRQLRGFSVFVPDTNFITIKQPPPQILFQFP